MTLTCTTLLSRFTNVCRSMLMLEADKRLTNSEDAPPKGQKKKVITFSSIFKRRFLFTAAGLCVFVSAHPGTAVLTGTVGRLI